MSATMTLTPIAPGRELNGLPSINMFSDDRSPSQFLREDIDAFFYDRSSQTPASGLRMPASTPQPKPAELSTVVEARSSDPYVAVKEMLWLLPGINDIVQNTLWRMEKAFAYNSVYFLKIILDMQATYVTMKPAPSSTVILETPRVISIAEVLSNRLARRDKDALSLSRELQLRTLIAALSLLHQMGPVSIEKDTYANILRDISARDADNDARYNEVAADKFKTTGENEFLTRYAYDLARELPNDFRPMKRDDPDARLMLFAHGFIDQKQGLTSPLTLETALDRINSPPSRWYECMRNLYEGTTGATALQHELQSSQHPSQSSRLASALAADVARSLVERIQDEVKVFSHEKNPLLFGLLKNGRRPTDPETVSARESELFICGLLDQLALLVGTFPSESEVVEEAKALAGRLVKSSDKKTFRYKSFEIFIASTNASTETEYYDTMRNLELEIENSTMASPYFDSRTDEQKQDSVHHIEQLKKEKRETMDRCEKKKVLFTGAVESMQRRLQQHYPSSPHRETATLEELAHISASLDDAVRYAVAGSPVPSKVPTLDSTHSGDSSGVSSTPTPTFEPCMPTQVQNSPCESSTWQTISSPTDTIVEDRERRPAELESSENGGRRVSRISNKFLTPQLPLLDTTVFESPIIPDLLLHTPSLLHTPLIEEKKHHEPATPASPTPLGFHELSQLFSQPGLSLYMEDDYFTEDEPLQMDANVRKMSFDLPIQTFESFEASSVKGAVEIYGREIRLEDSRESLGLPYRRAGSKPSMDSLATFTTLGSEVNQQSILEEEPETPLSMYPEPPLSRKSTQKTSFGQGSLRRSSRTMKPRRVRSMQLDKPLPPVLPSERNKMSILADSAPEPIRPGSAPIPVGAAPRPRSHSTSDIRNAKVDALRANHKYSMGTRTQGYSGFSPMEPIVDYETPIPTGPVPDYETAPEEKVYKVHAKDSCFATFISSDIRHAVFLSPHSFQVFPLPSSVQPPQSRPKFCYRLGESEGCKKSKSLAPYLSAAVSDRYIATVTKDRLQVHDLSNNLLVIFSEPLKGWEYSCVAIGNDKIVVGLSKALRGESIGKLRVYRMNSMTYDGPRYEIIGRDISLPINPRSPVDSPRLLTLSLDGNFVSCATPRFGYYFAWDISRLGAAESARLWASGKLRRTEGPGAETLTGAMLFPDARHIFCTTFPITNHQPEWGGSFTEPAFYGGNPPSHRTIRQVSLRVNHSTIAPSGSAAAFLSKNGTIWVTPMALLEGENNITSFAPQRSKERMIALTAPDCASGKVAFSPDGQNLVSVDRKGKILMMKFGTKMPLLPPPPKKITTPKSAPIPHRSKWEKTSLGGYY